MYIAATDDGGSTTTTAAGKAPAPEVVVREVPAPEQQPEDLGFPAFATKNTTRVAGADPAADAAAVALAVHPSAGGVPGPDAVSLVDADEWPAGIAAASLVARAGRRARPGHRRRRGRPTLTDAGARASSPPRARPRRPAARRS